MTVDHEGVVRVVDDRGELHLQNAVELINNGLDVKLESPCHRVLLPGSHIPDPSRQCYRLSTDRQMSEQVCRATRSPNHLALLAKGLKSGGTSATEGNGRPLLSAS